MNQSITALPTAYVGLDVHKDSIDVALAQAGRDGEVRHLGTLPGELAPLDKLLRRLISTGQRLNIVYEAGPCGFVLYRHLTAQGLSCEVVAPSSIPKRPGDRVKTDRRDALLLARLSRAGELRAVRVPDAADEALRDLGSGPRGRGARAAQCTPPPQGPAAAQWHRLLGPGQLERGAPALAGQLEAAHPGQQISFQEYLHAVTEAGLRIARQEQALRAALPDWHLAPLVAALQALRGVPLIAAMTLVEGNQSSNISLNNRRTSASGWHSGSAAFPVRLRILCIRAVRRIQCALLTGKAISTLELSRERRLADASRLERLVRPHARRE